MRSATSKVVTGFDICVVALTCLSGAISGIFGLRETQEFNRRLKEVHVILNKGSNLLPYVILDDL